MANFSLKQKFLKIVYFPVYPLTTDDVHSTELGAVVGKMIKTFGTKLQEKLNISLQMIPNFDLLSSYRGEDGRWKGVLSDVQNNVIDLSLGPHVANPSIIQDFQVSPIFYQNSYMTLASTESQKPSNFFAFLSTFTIEIWYWIGISMLALIITTTLSELVSKKKKGLKIQLEEMISSNFWAYLAAFFQEGTPREPSTFRDRYLFASWLVALIVLLNSFTGEFKALLLIKAEGEKMANPDDLAKRPDLFLELPDYYSHHACFKDYPTNAEKIIWKSILKRGVEKSFFHSSLLNKPEIYQRVKDGGSVMMSDPNIIKINFAKMCASLKGSRTIYYFEGLCGSYYLILLASPKMDKEIYQIFYKSIRSITEANLVEKWMRDESKDLWKCFSNPEYNDVTPLSLKNLSGAFLIFVIMDLMALAVFVAEIIVHKIKKKNINRHY